MRILYNLLFFVGLALQVCVLQALLVGPRKRYPVLFFYSVVLLFITIIDSLSYFRLIDLPKTYADYYWTNDVVFKVLLFILVLSFINRALEGDPKKNVILRGLVLVAAALAGVSGWVLYDPNHMNSWMTDLSRNLAFFATGLNVVLWFALVRRKDRDMTLLMISGGLGIETTGEAIAQSLRRFSHSESTVWLPNLFLILTHMLCLYIWWKALRRSEATVPSEARPTLI